MRFTRAAACAIITLSLQSTAPYAQNLRSVQAPAEFPPASYTGRQYVDSNGCVFIRAGIAGSVTWVPRVTRTRSLICGQTPTFNVQQQASVSAPAEAQAAPRAAPRPVPLASNVELLTLDEPVAEVQAPVAAPATRQQTAQQAAEPAPAEPVRTAALKPAATAAVPQVARRARPAAQAVPAPSVAANATVFVDGARIETPAAAEGTTATVALKPKPVPARVETVTRAQTAQVAKQATAPRQVQTAKPQKAAAALTPRAASPSATQRVLPRHVYESRLSERNIEVPKGYAPVWQDGRLNIRRAEQTLAGDRRMKLVWTSTVPRRLVDQSTGRDVTAKMALVFPFTDTAQQERELGKVTLVRRNGKLMKRIQRNTARAKVAPADKPRASVSNVRAEPQAAAAPKAKPVQQAKTATRAKPAQPVNAGSRAFVQVGVFGVPANAQRAVQRLKAAGLPAQVGTVARNGKSLHRVVAGPFAAADASRALRAARAQGFGDAYLR